MSRRKNDQRLELLRFIYVTAVTDTAVRLQRTTWARTGSWWLSPRKLGDLHWGQPPCWRNSRRSVRVLTALGPPDKLHSSRRRKCVRVWSASQLTAGEIRRPPVACDALILSCSSVSLENPPVNVSRVRCQTYHCPVLHCLVLHFPSFPPPNAS